MRKENKVCTYDQALKLWSLGARLDTYWYWLHSLSEGVQLLNKDNFFGNVPQEAVPAPDVPELGRLLPFKIGPFGDRLYLMQSNAGLKFTCGYGNGSFYHFKTGAYDNEAHPRAEILITLLVHHHVKIEHLNSIL